MMDNPLSAVVIHDLEQLNSVHAEWTELWNRCPGATSFQRPEWVLSWTEVFRPASIQVITVRRGSKLAGLAPLFLYQAGSEKVLAPLAASISDYLDWLIEPEDSAKILEMILHTVGHTAIDWDRLDLTDLPPSSGLLCADFKGWYCERQLETACPALHLASKAEEVEEILPAKARHNLRTARRRMEKAGTGKVELADSDSLPEFLSTMFHLHGARWKEAGAPGVLANRNIQEFHRKAAPRLLDRGVLRLYGLRFNGALIATLYSLWERQVVYCYLQGFDPRYGALSPGVQILAAVVQDAIREGKHVVDFLRGREAYKYSWGARDRNTYRLCVRRSLPTQPASSVFAA